RPPEPDARVVAAHDDTALFFACPDVDGAYAHLRAHGVVAPEPKVAPYGMKQLYVADPDGYNLGFQWSFGAGLPDGVSGMADTIYTVKPGDNLTKIARQYGVTISRIVAANLIITDPNMIQAGWRIRIPATWQNPKVNSLYGGAKDLGNGSCQLLT